MVIISSPENEELNRFVEYILNGTRSEIIISKFNMNVTRFDLLTLDGTNWLNDVIINFYMELIKERNEHVGYLPKVHVLSTYFIGKLLKEGYYGVARWTRRVDIFAYDIILIPVNITGDHWCMSIIDFRNKTIKFHDSMGHSNYLVPNALMQYVKDESIDKRNLHYDTSDWSLECAYCPKQENGYDCGVFSCQIAEFVSHNADITFRQEHMEFFRRKMIYEIGNGCLLW